jgi:hypothetical protein
VVHVASLSRNPDPRTRAPEGQLGVIENLGTTVFGSGLRDITAFVVMILVLLVRPWGLLGTPQREKV